MNTTTALRSVAAGLLAAALLVAAAPAAERRDEPVGLEPLPLDPDDRDITNPRNVRWAWPVIETVGIEPRPHVTQIGDGPRPPEDEWATMVIAVHNAGDSPEGGLSLDGFGEGADATALPELAPGERTTVRVRMRTEKLPYGGHVLLKRTTEDATEIIDAFRVHGGDAHRVLILIDQPTLDDNDHRFGSAIRRLRKSFEDMHELYDVRGVEGLPEQGGDPDRPLIPDRFRLEHVERFDPEDGTPELFTEHPEFDFALAVNEGGPLCCFWLNDNHTDRYYSIGHNFRSETGGQVRGIWSNWGEQALWHEVFHYRGVPDYYIYNIPAGTLPGRTAEAWSLGMTPGTEEYRREIMNDTYTNPHISWLTATVAASKAGVSRIGACENPDHPYGHMWQWVPERLNVHVPGADAVRVYQSRPGVSRDRRIHGLPADAEPIAQAAADNATADGDYMNAGARRAARCLWLLVEADRDDETRWTILTLLELNEHYARGNKDEWTFQEQWDTMTPVDRDAE